MKKYAKSFAVFLIMTMVLSSFSGCGKTDSKAFDEGDKGPEMIYVPKERSISSSEKKQISDYCCHDGKFTYLIQEINDLYQVEKVILHSENLDGSDIVDTELELDLELGEYPMSMFFNDRGISLMVSRYRESGNELRVVDYDNGGKKVGGMKMEDLPTENTDNYIYEILKDDKGNYIASTYKGLYLYDDKGKVSGKISLDSDSFHQSHIFADSKGTVYVSGFDEKKFGTVIKQADFKNKKLIDKWENIPEGISAICEKKDGEFLVFTYDAIYTFSPKDDACKELVSFIDLDYVSVNAERVWINDDDTISFVKVDWPASGTGEPQITLVTLKEEVAVDRSKIKTITLGTLSPSDSLKLAVSRYNRSNGEYRVNLKTVDIKGDYMDARDKFISGALAGEYDIVNLNDLEGINYESYADLDPYFEKSGIDMSEYYEDVFNACKINGRMKSIPTSFSVRGYVGNSDLVGKNSSWTFDEFIDYIENNPDKKVIGLMAAYAFVYRCIYEMDSGILDYENGTCSFNSPEFKRILEVSKQYPLTLSDRDFEISEYSLLEKNELAITDLYLSDTINFQALWKVLGDRLNPIGMPGKEGSSFRFVVQENFAILSNCKEKDAAWDFLKTLLEDDYQGGDMWQGFPVKRTCLERKLTATKSDSFGGGSIEYADGTRIFLGAPTQEEYDVMKSIIDRAEGIVSFDGELFGILEEEYPSFYNGEKSADDVADIIQNRVSIYLAEKY